MARQAGPLVLRRVYDNQDFADALQMMLNRMAFSEQKYGPLESNYPVPHHARQNARARLARYENTHNREYLLDVANFAIIEYLRPSFPDAYFEAMPAEATSLE